MLEIIEENIFPDLSPRAEIFQKVEWLEKAWLDNVNLAYPDALSTVLSKYHFLRLNGVPVRYDQNQNKFYPSVMMPELLASIYGQFLPFVYIIICHNRRIDVLAGTNFEGAPVVESVLHSIHGHTLCSTVSTINRYVNLNSYGSCAAMTGIPADPTIRKRDSQKQNSILPGIDSLISALIHDEWVYIVQAFPVQRSQVASWFERCTCEIKEIKEAYLHRDIQQANRMASYYVEALNKSVRRLNIGKQIGFWQTGVYLFSDNEITVRKGAALLASLFSNHNSGSEPLRSHICKREGKISPFINGYNSIELRHFISLPAREYPGFRLREQIDFDVDFSPSVQHSLSIGEVMNDGDSSGQICSLPVDDLARHTMIAGVTGSGKTNTVFNMLNQVHHSNKTPFLVIEPAKSEYRGLMKDMNSLLVFTLGEERPDSSAPFRLNPFVFPQGVTLQTHIDFLKAVFHASFVMYAPMPYVLEECLYKIYQDRGWNLVTSTNSRGTGHLSFPTLSDLYHKIDEVVMQLGYQDRTTMDIKAALKTRIRNLCIGAKGMMLNTSTPVPFDNIMNRPVVMELKSLGNDEEKAFIMGLLLMSIYEHHESARFSGKAYSSDLRHITVIEEAHRLLKNVPTEKSSEEQNNIKGMGVETFCNLLAEIRAYGEGIVVSEQIPAKLAPDVIKNSNLKIMHRLVAKEDRELLGDTMNLDLNQQRGVLSLKTGEAILFREGLDRPVKIKIGLTGQKAKEYAVSNRDVCRYMNKRFFKDNPDLLVNFHACHLCKNQKYACKRTKQHVEEIISSNNWGNMVVKFFLPCLLNPKKIDARTHLLSLIHLKREEIFCFIAHMLYGYISFKGRYNDWNFKDIEDLTKRSHSLIQNNMFIEEIVRFCTYHRCEAPYSLCNEYCKCNSVICYEGSVLSSDPVLHNKMVKILDTSQYNTRFHVELFSMLGAHLREFLPEKCFYSLGDIVLCYLIHKLNELHISMSSQRHILDEYLKVSGSTA